MSAAGRLAAVVLMAWPALAAAQAQPDRFFADKPTDEAEDDETLVQGSVTSTTFVHRETASISQPLPGGNVGADNASPIDRIFTDLRGQVDARHIKGGNWDARGDVRVRLTPGDRFQSGTFSGHEYDLREMYLRRAGDRTDWTLGRQFVLELAAIKIDGLRGTYHASENWSYIGFAGLHPARGSRSIETDYPVQRLPDPMEEGARIMPVAMGAGGAYRYEKYYGSIGAVGILPMAEDLIEGGKETPRIFVTGNGYYRQSHKLDLYHHVVVDVDGAAGQGLTNLSAGATYRPNPTMRVTGGVNRVDTETLNVIAQTQLKEPEPLGAAFVQNNIAVSRIASQSARLGLSVALRQRRFEISTDATIRQRPEIAVVQGNDVAVIIPAAEAAEVGIRVLDRRSFKDLRVGVSYLNMFGIGDDNLRRSSADIARLEVSRDLRGGKGQIDADVSLMNSRDENRQDTCNPIGTDQLTCYGTSKAMTLSLGAMVFYRIKPDWFVIGGANVGRQVLTTTAGMDEPERQPAILLTTGFARIAYRF